jgi:hypothetical protein
MAAVIISVNEQIETEDHFYSYLPHHKLARTMELIHLGLLDRFGEYTQQDEDIVFTTILRLRLGEIDE